MKQLIFSNKQKEKKIEETRKILNTKNLTKILTFCLLLIRKKEFLL